MKILITGVNGQVGHALMRELAEHELIGLTRKDCDLTNSDQIKQVIDQHQPDLIINPAAYTKVDQAEDEPELAFKINRDAPRVMAEKAREYHIPLIHFSTDYVFDGKKELPYLEDDSTNPLGVYGKSKLFGEKVIQEVGSHYYIMRTSWVYSKINHNFHLTMKRLANDNDKIKVVANQVGVPTSNLFIANQIKKIIPLLNESNIGIYNLVPDGYCSWYKFAKAIISRSNPKYNLENIIPIDQSEYITKAQRPMNSVLNNKKIKNTFMIKFKDWKNLYEDFIYES